jgi:hypothetical protein
MSSQVLQFPRYPQIETSYLLDRPGLQVNTSRFLRLIPDFMGRICIYIHIYIIEGSLEVKLPTIWTDEKQRWEESERREE